MIRAFRNSARKSTEDTNQKNRWAAQTRWTPGGVD